MLEPTIATEFPAIDPRVSCRRNHRLVMLCRPDNDTAPHPMFTGVAHFDDRHGQMATYLYPPTVIPEEHLYVPARGSEPEQGGWIVGTALDFAREQTQLNLCLWLTSNR